VKFGLTIFPTDDGVDVRDLARAVEDAGYESLLLPEHTHIPTSRRTPFPAGGELPREYTRTHDPFVALGAVAAVTSRIKIGTGVCLLAQRDPIVTAKEVASLDHLSGGRVLFGIGGGWNAEECESHGVPFRLRWRVLRERVLAMKAIWAAEDAAEFHGRHVDVGPLWQWPKPLQQPHPPVILGGNGPRALERVVDYADEWMPLPVRTGPPLDERIAELQRLAATAGRGPIPVSIYGARPDLATIDRLAAAGVSRCVFWLRPGPAADVLPLVHTYGELAKAYG
jgi:probable F420-dependent oxidoreductase